MPLSLNPSQDALIEQIYHDVAPFLTTTQPIYMIESHGDLLGHLSKSQQNHLKNDLHHHHQSLLLVSKTDTLSLQTSLTSMDQGISLTLSKGLTTDQFTTLNQTTHAILTTELQQTIKDLFSKVWISELLSDINNRPTLNHYFVTSERMAASIHEQHRQLSQLLDVLQFYVDQYQTKQAYCYHYHPKNH